MIAFYQSEDIHKALDAVKLVDALDKAFAKPGYTPDRSVITHEGLALLTKPSFNQTHGGVKLITVSPSNAKKSIAPIQGIYYLFDVETGQPKAVMDAKSLTNLRTAAASVLAAKYLAVPDPRTLLVIGTGQLSPYVITSYCSWFQIETVLLYGRNLKRTQAVSQFVTEQGIPCQTVVDLADAVRTADIVSCVTSSTHPLIIGEWLQEGQHLDLIGSFTPEMREADTDAVLKSRLYVDNRSTAFTSGDLFVPKSEGRITTADIQGDLFELCSGNVEGRISNDEITLFKSVGHAMEDLIAAELVYSYYNG